MKYWLMKSEPEEFSIEDLRQRPDQTEPWNGIRNYQARNFMRDYMSVGDPVLFYHSNCETPGIVGSMRVAREAYPDPTQFDPESDYYDPKSTPENPRWLMVDVQFVAQWPRTLSLAELKAQADRLPDCRLLMKGNRLSILPLSRKEWTTLHKLAGV